MIEIHAIGGYNDVGKNCTAINVDGEVIIIDLGIHLENYIKLTEEEDLVKVSTDQLMRAGAIPNINNLGKLRNNIKAVIISHAHLDHLGAVPYIADKFKAPIIGTPFAIEVIKSILSDDKITLKNEMKVLNSNSFMKLTENIELEFIHITHSTPQTALVALHTKYGTILYANDFKLDLYPTLGKKPNFKRLKELGEKGILALVVESTYASDARKMPSENVAKDMLQDVERIDQEILLLYWSNLKDRLNFRDYLILYLQVQYRRYFQLATLVIFLILFVFYLQQFRIRVC